jgi:hypothetical protein
MRREKRVHVVKRGKKWVIWKQEKSRASRIYNKKEDAIEAGIELTEQGYDLIIHNKDGTVQKWLKARTTRTIKTPQGVGSIPREEIERAVKKVMKEHRG